MDFERGYETFQAQQTFPWNYSGFAPEDPPSDYLGAWAYLNGYTQDEVPIIMERMGEVVPLSNNFTFGIQFSIRGVALNREFLPMVYTGGLFGKWQNVPWPAWLESPPPIESGPNTWQRVEVTDD